MPKIKTRRMDILRNVEVEDMLKRATPWLACLIALAWIFGKRISEILRLRKEDVWTTDSFLFARFTIGKKHTHKETPVPKFYIKKINREHPYVHYILDHFIRIRSGWLFPHNIPERVKIVRMKKIDRTYTYKREGGHLYSELALYYLKKLNPDTWWHLFRESLATQMAEHEATEEELMHWFDWDRPATAHAYVKRGTRLTKKWSERKW